MSGEIHNNRRRFLAQRPWLLRPPAQHDRFCERNVQQNKTARSAND
jgi:hypothetical protein